MFSTLGGKAALAALNATLATFSQHRLTFFDVFDETQLDALHRRANHLDPNETVTSISARAWRDTLVDVGLNEMASVLDPWLAVDPKATTIASSAAVHGSTIIDTISLSLDTLTS